MLLTQCPICKDTLVRSADIVSAPCGHTYHEYCLLEWLKTKSNCPQCRKICQSNRVKRLYFDFVEEESFTNNGDADAVKIEKLRTSLESTRSKVSHLETLLANSETACEAAVARMEKCQTGIRETEKELQKEKGKNNKLRTEVRQQTELLHQLMQEKVEVEDLRQEMATMKDIDKLLKGTAHEARELLQVFELQAESDTPQAAMRHLVKLVSVLRLEMDTFKSEKRELRRDNHRLDKELAQVRRQMANETSAVVAAREELDQEKAHVAWLERERDSLKTKISQLVSSIRSPTADTVSSLARRVAFESPMIQPTNNDRPGTSRDADLSSADLFDLVDDVLTTPLRERVSVNSSFFETPSPVFVKADENTRPVNPFALKRRSSSAAEEIDDNNVEKKKTNAQRIEPQRFNILRSHLLTSGMMNKEKRAPKTAEYDGFGSRQTASDFITPPRPIHKLPGELRKKNKIKVKNKKVIDKTCPKLDNFLQMKRS